jgi:hypothetical protein
MRAVKNIEQVVEASNGKIHLDGINIGGKEYILDIVNNDGELTLDFNECDYIISIDREGIRFSRTAYSQTKTIMTLKTCR